MSAVLNQGTGWVPETHSPNDLHEHHDEVRAHLEQRGVFEFSEARRAMPARADLREWAPPVNFQGGYNTCAAHVVACLLEYFENRAHGSCIPPSRLFLYKVAKNFLQETGNTGIYIRQVMGVLKSIGAPPEKYWPYVEAGTFSAPRSDDPRIDEEPTAFCYAVARNFEAISYYRLDRAKETRDQSLLQRAKAHLAAGLPFAFGFPLYESIKQSEKTGKVAFPSDRDKCVGNHAVVAMGYDDAMTVGGQEGHAKTTGALLVHNSWSCDWGEKGYGWIPYRFVTEGLTADFWTLTNADWLDLCEYGQ